MDKKKKIKIFLADLSYFNNYSISGNSIPLNVGYIAAYVLQMHGDNCEVSVFKNPENLLSAAKLNPPDVLGLSCYAWNTRLDVLIAERIKKLNSNCIVAVGGPNIDNEIEGQLEIYNLFKGNIDFLLINEGEFGFSNIIQRLIKEEKDSLFQTPINGCLFFKNNERFIGEDTGLSSNLNMIPSPILSGVLDKFLVPEYMPMLQTSRGCPYGCSYCCSGKIRCKLRNFSLQVIKDEIKYIAKKYQNYPHKMLFITDENFGLNKQDPIIAKYLIKSKKEYGYPKETFCYFDKRLTPLVKESILALSDINSGGLQLGLQSFNKDTLDAIKRINITEENFQEILDWTKKNNIRISVDMIFGLPYETKDTFLNALEYLLKSKIELIGAHNVFLLKGSELNRKSEREKFGLVTKFRPTSYSSLGMIDNEFVCESEEVIVGSSYFSFEDFMDLRRILMLFFANNYVGYFQKVMNYLIDINQKVTPISGKIMNPNPENIVNKKYTDFVDDFVRDAKSELCESHEEVFQRLKEEFICAGNKVTKPTRWNVFYTARLIYLETWFGEVIKDILLKLPIDDKDKQILQDLIKISANEWIDLENPKKGNEVIISEDTLDYLKLSNPQPLAGKYLLKMSASEEQVNKVTKFNEQYKSEDSSYYYNALNVIRPWKTLRFSILEVIPIA